MPKTMTTWSRMRREKSSAVTVRQIANRIIAVIIVTNGGAKSRNGRG